jgi:hypothetical protein
MILEFLERDTDADSRNALRVVPALGKGHRSRGRSEEAFRQAIEGGRKPPAHAIRPLGLRREPCAAARRRGREVLRALAEADTRGEALPALETSFGQWGGLAKCPGECTEGTSWAAGSPGSLARRHSGRGLRPRRPDRSGRSGSGRELRWPRPFSCPGGGGCPVSYWTARVRLGTRRGSGRVGGASRRVCPRSCCGRCTSRSTRSQRRSPSESAPSRQRTPQRRRCRR